MAPSSRGNTSSHPSSPANASSSINLPASSSSSSHSNPHPTMLSAVPSHPPPSSSEKYLTDPDRDPYGAFDDKASDSYAMESKSGPKKGDYSLLMDEERQAEGSRMSSIANPNQGHIVMVDNIASHPAVPIASYCVASVIMTVVNKFVLSGHSFDMNFLLLMIQSAVCVTCVTVAKRMKIITFRDFDSNDARRWFPVSVMLVSVIYTGSKSLQHLSIPVYTIFKNLTIILIAYGEVIWFEGRVTGLTLISFGLMVLSSLMAAWSDISHALSTYSTYTRPPPLPLIDPTTGLEEPVSAAAAAYGATDLRVVMGNLNTGYVWMIINCVVSAAYVLAMRKRIKVTNFKDWDTMFYNNLLSIPVLLIFSLIAEDWSSASFLRNFPVEGRHFLLFAMVFSGAAAAFISYTTAWCLRTTSSTTFSMVGALNKLPVAASGMIFFGDPITTGSVSAVSTGFIAGMVYATAKANQQRMNQQPGGGVKR